MRFFPRKAFSYYGGGVKPACRDGFTQIYNLIFSRPLREGVNVWGWLVSSPRPLWERVNVWGWLVSSPRPLWEREKPFLSCKAKVTDSGEGSTQEIQQSASLCSGKLFSDTLPLCSRYRFENLSLAPLRLNLASVVFPRHPIPECVMLNLFQHLTGLACDLPSCKILNSSKIEWETNTHNNIIKTDFLRFQDDNAYTTPRPLSIQLRKDHSRPMCHVILSPITIQGRRIPKTYFVILSPLSIWGRRISKTLQKGDSSGFHPQNDGTLVTLASPRPLGESGFSVGRCRACGSGSVVRKDVNSFPQASKPVRWREAGNFPTPRIIQGGKCIEWLVVSPRPLGERVEFQVERERNLEIRVRGFKTFTPHKLKRCA